MRITASDTLHNVDGMVPINKLFACNSILTNGRFPNVDGTAPDNKLLLKIKEVSCVSPNVDGMVPFNAFMWKSSEMSRAKLPTSDGMVPVNRCCRNRKLESCVNFPNVVGMEPVNRFDVAVKSKEVI